MTIIERISSELEKRGIKPSKMSKDLGFSSGLFTQWKNNEQQPSREKLIKIAEYLNVSLNYLMGIEDNINSEAEELYERYQKLSPEQRELIDNMFAQFEKKK